MTKAMICAASLLALSAGAQARTFDSNAGPIRSVRVNVADINAASEAGRALLYRRVRSAADEVCANDGDFSVATKLAIHSCVKKATQDGDRQLAQLFGARTALASAQLAVSGR